MDSKWCTEQLKMKRIVSYSILGLVSMTVTACYYDNQEELHPGAFEVCDTTDYTYAGKVTEILQRSCYSCHSQNSPSGNVILSTYSGVKTVADNGKLVGSIDHLTGYSSMPQNLPQLSECDRATIKKWMQNGTTNN